MKRRDFLKLIGLAPLAPSVLATKEVDKIVNLEEWLHIVDQNKAFAIGFDPASSLINVSSCVIYHYELGPDGKYEKIDEWTSIVESPL